MIGPDFAMLPAIIPQFGCRSSQAPLREALEECAVRPETAKTGG
jgi:hypothetical protein